MFDTLSAKLDAALAKVKGRGRLDEKTVDATLKEIRLALLEADVNFRVVKQMVQRLREQLVGEEVSKALNPSQQVIKAVDAELREALGGESVGLRLTGKPAVIMLAGLQGSGKTTAAGKLAKLLRSKGRHPMLVACDLQRPAAVQQLKVNAERAGVHVYAPVTSGDPVPVARDSIAKARETGCDVVIVDTAGRLHVDEELLEQARAIREAVDADETLFVIDAMIGQEAVNVAKAFADAVGFDGVILSKLDGDARGGAALSVRSVTGAPIKFASVGEKLEDFEPFHPDRMASRILGMGDVLSLVEEVERKVDQDKARALAGKLKKGKGFDLADLRDQLGQMLQMGGMDALLDKLPSGLGGGALKAAQSQFDDRQVRRQMAIIDSMTPAERRQPRLINGSRKRRIAAGAGLTIPDVNRLLKQHAQMQKMMKKMTKGGGLKNMMRGLGGGRPMR